MGTTIKEFANSTGQRVWLDFYDYAADLLAGGIVPWLDQAQFSAFHSKAQALIKSGVIGLPVEPIVDVLLLAQPGILEKMRAKSRPGYPLRSLLEQAELRIAITQLLQVLRAANPSEPLALLVPSPKRWLATAYQQAQGVSLDLTVAQSADDISGAAIYVADFLRSFAELQVDALVLVETSGQSPKGAAELRCYDPVSNKANHYRWELGILDMSASPALLEPSGVSFYLSPSLPAGTRGGRILGPGFWSGELTGAAAGDQFHYAVVPRGTQPEVVLQRLGEVF